VQAHVFTTFRDRESAVQCRENPRPLLVGAGHASKSQIPAVGCLKETAEIVEYMIPKSPDHIGETREFIEQSIADREQSTEFIFVIMHKNTHEFLGVCALQGSLNPARPDLGLWLKKSAHGNRYGREAIRNLKEWAELNLRVDEFVYPVDRRNIPSRKIAEALGGGGVEEKRTPTMRGAELDTLVYVIPANGERTMSG
jgi:[ribosomal protein S5]-alanine N-acetyltransferase